MSPLARNPLGNFSIDNRLEDRTVPATPVTALTSDLSFLTNSFGQNALATTNVDTGEADAATTIDLGKFDALVKQATGEPAVGGRVVEVKAEPNAVEKKPDTGKVSAPLWLPPDVSDHDFGFNSIPVDADTMNHEKDLLARSDALEEQARQNQFADMQNNASRQRTEPPKKIEVPKTEKWKDPFDALDRGQRLPPLVSSEDVAKLLLRLQAQKQAEGGGQAPKITPGANEGATQPMTVEPKEAPKMDEQPVPPSLMDPKNNVAPAPRAKNPAGLIAPIPVPRDETQQMNAVPNQQDANPEGGSNVVSTTAKAVALAFAASLALDPRNYNLAAKRRQPDEAAFV